MLRTHYSSLSKRIAAFLLLILTSVCAYTQDHYWSQQYGGRATLTGGTEVAGSTDNGAIYYNPGSIGFIDSARITASTYIYGLEYARLKNGAGTGVDLKNIHANILPQLLAGSVLLKKVPKLKLIFGTLTRGRTNNRFNQENEGFYEVINGSPGLEYYKARIEHSYNSVEQWAGFGIAYEINGHWAVGLSSFATYTHMEVRATQNSSVDATADGSAYTATVNEYNEMRLNQFMHVFKLGLAARFKHVQLGLSLTPPGIRVWGEGKLEKSFEVHNLNQNPSDTTMQVQRYGSYVISDVQKRLKSYYQIPLSVSGGFKLIYPSFTLSFAAEYFMGYKNKTVMNGANRSIIHPASIYGNDTIAGFMHLSTTALPVINGGMGLEVRVTKALDLLFGLRTDFTNHAEFLPGNSVINVPTARTPNWDYLHISTGISYKLAFHNVTIGFDYGLGFSGNKQQIFNLTEPEQGLYLRGPLKKDMTTSAHKLDFILSYSYFFKSKEKKGPMSIVEEFKKSRREKKSKRAMEAK